MGHVETFNNTRACQPSGDKLTIVVATHPNPTANECLSDQPTPTAAPCGADHWQRRGGCWNQLCTMSVAVSRSANPYPPPVFRASWSGHSRARAPVAQLQS